MNRKSQCNLSKAFEISNLRHGTPNDFRVEFLEKVMGQSNMMVNGAVGHKSRLMMGDNRRENF